MSAQARHLLARYCSYVKSDINTGILTKGTVKCQGLAVKLSNQTNKKPKQNEEDSNTGSKNENMLIIVETG